MIDRELKLWRDYYGQGMCHLFLEDPYHTAQLLNGWMKAEDDAILEAVYADWAGTQAQQESVKAFFQTIKAECPETVFHGTDVGHQYQTIGERYLSALKAGGLREVYGEALQTEDLSWLAAYVETAKLTVNGKEYEADCFRRDMWEKAAGFDHGDYWRLKDVGEDFRNCPLGEDVLPYYNYPVEVESGQAFLAVYTLTDGT